MQLNHGALEPLSDLRLWCIEEEGCLAMRSRFLQAGSQISRPGTKLLLQAEQGSEGKRLLEEEANG
jgi:hypothetical protein